MNQWGLFGELAVSKIAGPVHPVTKSAGGLQVIEVMRDRFDRTTNVGQSLPVDGGADLVIAARLRTRELDVVSQWDLSGDGAERQSSPPDGNWKLLVTPGSDASVSSDKHQWHHLP